MLMRAATVVQVLHGLFYALFQLLVVAAITLCFKFYCTFYCKFYCSCDPSLMGEITERAKTKSDKSSLTFVECNFLAHSHGTENAVGWLTPPPRRRA